MKIERTEKFKKIFKKWVKKHPNLVIEFKEAIYLFVDNPFYHKLRTHKLSGNLKHLWSFSINYEHRILFEFIGDDTVVFHTIGTHDEVY